VKKTLNIFFVVLLTTLCIFYTNLISIAYAQETKLTPIMGESQATQEQAIQILKERNRIDNNDPKSDQYIEDFVNTTWEEAATEGVRADIAFSLMMLETNFLKSEYVDQNNFGGLGVYEGGAPASFDNVRLGIRAVVQHIKAYASTAHLVNECIDPRFKLITTRGCAEYLEWLGQKENPQGYGWATANGHGYRILNILNQMCGNPLTPFIHELNVTRSGSTYNITTQSTNADGALYKFVAINTTTGQQTVIQNYSQKSTATWTPSNSGSYIIKAYIKRPSSPYEYDAFTTCNVTVQNWVQTTIKSFTVDKPEVYAGQAFTATVVATSMNKPLYKFWIGEQSSDGKWSWTVIQNYSEKNYVTYTLKKPGIYGLSVYVKDSLSNIDPEVVKKCDVTVIASPTTIESFTVDKPEVYAGQAFTATVVATSMNKPLYKFWIGEQSSDGKWSWTVIQNYSEKNYVTYTLKKPGIYGLSVYVKDSLSSIDPEVVKKCDVTVIAIATIVLDAGHGGSDPGAVSSANTGSLKESDLNLQQTLILGNILESNGFNVIYTRDNKTSNPTLSERATLANDINADLFISIHHDSSTSKSAHGISTHYSTYRPLLDNEGLYVEYSSMWGDITCDATPCEAAVKSKNLAEKLAKNIASLGFYNRGAHDHNLYVTKMTTMPSVLIEVGFMSNDEEVLRVSNPNMMKAIAQKIADTIIEFFNIN